MTVISAGYSGYSPTEWDSDQVVSTDVSVQCLCYRGASCPNLPERAGGRTSRSVPEGQ